MNDRKHYQEVLEALQGAHRACFHHQERDALGMSNGPFSGVNKALEIVARLEQENFDLRASLKMAAIMHRHDLIEFASKLREAIDGYTRGAFTGWVGMSGSSRVTLDDAEDHFSLCMADLRDSFDETASEFIEGKRASASLSSSESLANAVFDDIERDLEAAGCLVMTDEGLEAFKEIVTGHLSRMTDLIYNLHGSPSEALPKDSQMTSQAPGVIDQFHGILRTLVDAALPAVISGDLQVPLKTDYVEQLRTAVQNATRFLPPETALSATTIQENEIGVEPASEETDETDELGDLSDLHFEDAQDTFEQQVAARRELLKIFRELPPA